jgi:hypothetical protein
MKPVKTLSKGQRMKKVVLVIILMDLLALPALAHQGVYESIDTTGFQNPIVLAKPTVSYAVYMRLDHSGDVDYVSFKVDGPMKVKASLLVPQRPEFLDYYPVFAVVGPGLPAPEIEVPFEMPAGCGAVVLKSEPQTERGKFYEPFSMTRYYRGFKVFEQEVTEPGTYYIVVWHPAGEYGDYVVIYGEKESFTPKEMLKTYRAISKVWTGKWGKFRGHPPTQ